MNPQVSIIVPIYNKEKYLSRCIDSIINQTLKDLEIILVDDGSTDTSVCILDEYKKTDSRITVIRKVNGGASSARNEGLKIANGEYVMFIDADDWIDLDYCEYILNQAKKSGADIVRTGFEEILEEGVRGDTFKVILKDQDIITKEEIAYNFAFRKPICGSVFGKLYKREVIKDLKFDNNLKFAEDIKFYISAILKAESVSIRNNNGYKYFRNNFSVTISDKSTRVWLDTMQVLSEGINEYQKSQPQHARLFGTHLCMVLMGVYDYLTKHKTSAQDKQLKKTTKRYYSQAKKSFKYLPKSARLKLFLYRYFLNIVSLVK